MASFKVHDKLQPNGQEFDNLIYGGELTRGHTSPKSHSKDEEVNPFIDVWYIYIHKVYCSKIKIFWVPFLMCFYSACDYTIL